MLRPLNKTGNLYLNQIRSEEPFGDFSLGPFAWLLEDVKPLIKPIPAKGQLGLWEFDLEAM